MGASKKQYRFKTTVSDRIDGKKVTFLAGSIESFTAAEVKPYAGMVEPYEPEHTSDEENPEAQDPEKKDPEN